MSHFDEIIRYHERTKHHPHRYAPSLGYLDWEEQPNPFRFFEGITRVDLPRDLPELPVNFSDLYSNEVVTSKPLDKNSLSQFLSLSLGLSAWKAIGQNSWSLRINPSSGNLHPTEAHLWAPELEGLSAGCYHYTPLLHALEKRSSELLLESLKNGFIIGLSSIYWRESWKYGERGFRYCQHDLGHATSALSFAASLFGWEVNRLALSDSEFETLFGFNKTKWLETEEEKPDLALWISQDGTMQSSHSIKQMIERSESISFLGTPKPLSKKPLKWEEIESVSLATRRETPQITVPASSELLLAKSKFPTEKLASDIIMNRRSAVDFDGHTTISKDTLLTMLANTLATKNNPAFPGNMHGSEVNLFLFVHRVEGLATGLYLYLRTDDLENQKYILNKDFLWKQMDNPHPLYLLKEGDFRVDAKAVSCNQDIAADGAFSLGMVARFERNIKKNQHSYRELFWETGMIGQVFYLNAEAFLVRTTGIGCFFDDEMHYLLGLKDHEYQSLYHLSVGGPVEDARLTTLPAYAHLK